MSRVSASTDKQAMQLAVVNASSALTMPQEEFVEFYCQPIEDDTWIRHEEIVKMENMVDTEGGAEIKKVILKEYIEERVRTGQTIPPDPILVGMLAQEQFMEEYQHTDRRADGDKAAFYRSQLVNKFRRSHPKPEQPPAPFGEEDTDIDSDREEKSEHEVVDNSNTETATAEVPVPEGEAQAETQAEEYPTEPEQPEAQTKSGKSAPVASSPKAAGSQAEEYPVEEPTGAAENIDATADEL